MFVNTLKGIVSLMALAIVVLIILVVTGTCHLEFHPKDKPAVITSHSTTREFPIISPLDRPPRGEGLRIFRNGGKEV